jgi:secreted trypsin-like serine protease
MILFLLLFELLVIYIEPISTADTYVCSSNSSCGCSPKSVLISKIVGGESAASETWNWAVSLRRSSTGSHFCGGSVISPWHILTAAHCTINLVSPSSVRVVVGSIYLSNGVQQRTVAKIYNHPLYSSSTYVNDISILKLSSALDLSQAGINLICLPNVSSNVLAKQEYPPVNVKVRD